jgi:hypothetical protein
MAGNASGRTSFSPARSCAAVHGTAMCVLLTLISMGCSLDSPAKAPPFDPVTRRIDSTLAGESLRHKGADYATRRLELPTFVWSVVPPGLDSPAPADQTPEAVRCSASAASRRTTGSQAAAPLPSGDCASGGRERKAARLGRSAHAVPMQDAGTEPWRRGCSSSAASVRRRRSAVLARTCEREALPLVRCSLPQCLSASKGGSAARSLLRHERAALEVSRAGRRAAEMHGMS